MKYNAGMEWIKIEDRFPEEDKEVLVCYWESMADSFCVGIGYYYTDEWEGWKVNFAPLQIVTHWMPLPELPK